jgi:hypothetical protein
MIVAVLLSCLLAAGLGHSQTVVEGREEVDFDRPEAWALKYFGSVTLLTGMGIPQARRPGSFEIGLEVGWIPSLSEDQRRVGFNGSKVEDLNKLPVSPRPHLLVGLPWRTTLDMTWVPPVELDGIKANLVAIAIERPVVQGDRWSLGLRLAAQIGETSGDYTCSQHDASFPPGSTQNPFGCEEPSSDTASIDYQMIGITGGHRVGGGETSIHYGVYATHFDLEFQVDALTYGIRDRTQLATDGWTWSAATGATFRLAERSRLTLEALYTPLDVQRSPLNPATENDPLFNLRAMYGFTWKR